VHLAGLAKRREDAPIVGGDAHNSSDGGNQYSTFVLLPHTVCSISVADSFWVHAHDMATDHAASAISLRHVAPERSIRSAASS
jgi:hypothetical protein